jgi:hypothetical protein
MADLCKVERIRADGFAQVLDFFYTSKLYITPSNVVDVLEAADFLQLRRVVKTCASILLQHIEHSNAPAIEILAQAHSCRGLASAAREHTLTNLRDVAARSVEFGRLSTSVRRSYVAEARHQFRLPDQPHAHHHPSTIRCVIAPSQEHVAAYDEHADDLSTLLSSRPTDVLVVVPAESGAADAKVLYLNPGPPAAWNVLTTLPFSRPRALYAVIAVDHSTLFVTGGEDCAEVLLRDDPQQYSVSKYDDVYAYSVADGDGAVWRQYSPMRARRSNHSAAESLGRVYVVGGHEFDVDPENEAEVFDPQTGQWTALPGRHGLHSGVTWSRCAAVALGDRIYVFGGSQRQHAETVVESNHLTYGGAQVFDIDNGEWEESPSLFSCLVKSKMKVCLTKYKSYLVVNFAVAYNHANYSDPLAHCHRGRVAWRPFIRLLCGRGRGFGK